MDRHPPDPRPELPPGRLLRLAWGFYLILALLGLVWIGARLGQIPVTLFAGARWFIDLGLGLGLGLAVVVLWELLERRLETARELARVLRERLGPLERDEALGLALLSGFAEEFFFRGAVQGAWGFFWATLLFGLLHLGPGRALRLWAVFATVIGALFGALVLWRGTLLAPIVAHVVINAVNLWRLTVRS